MKSRLTEDGVFVQWMNAEFLDEELLARLAATLLAEFKYVRIYEPSALALHFVASDGPIDIGQQLATTGRPLGDDPLHYARNGINSPFSLANALLLDERGVAQIAVGYKPTTDDDNRMAFDSQRECRGALVQFNCRVLQLTSNPSRTQRAGRGRLVTMLIRKSCLPLRHCDSLIRESRRRHRLNCMNSGRGQARDSAIKRSS